MVHLKPRRRTVKPKPQPWTLSRLYTQCRASVAVWVALDDMAGERGSSTVTPTRAQLMARTGITREKTISTALTLLVKALWIDRDLVPVVEAGKQTATLIRIVTRRGTHQKHRKGRKLPHTEKSAVKGGKRPTAKGQKTPQDFPKGKGRTGSPPSLPGGAASASTTRGKGTGATNILDDASSGDCVPVSGTKDTLRPIAEILGLTNG